MADTKYDDPRNIKRRVFNLRLTFQGIDALTYEWEVSSQSDLDEFKAEVMHELSAHLDGCLSNGSWGFEITSYEPSEV